MQAVNACGSCRQLKAGVKPALLSRCKAKRRGHAATNLQQPWRTAAWGSLRGSGRRFVSVAAIAALGVGWHDVLPGGSATVLLLCPPQRIRLSTPQDCIPRRKPITLYHMQHSRVGCRKPAQGLFHSA